MPGDLSSERTQREALERGTGERLHRRAHALEEAFFAKRERELLAALQKKIEDENELGALLEQCGIRDTRTAETLVACGIRATTLPALILTPLLAVTWADGELQRFERELVVKRALLHRIVPNSDPWELMQSWLAAKPPAPLFEAWLAYAQTLAEAMPAPQRADFAREILDMAKEIAEQTRRHRRFDLGRCVEELRVIDRIERVFGEMGTA